MILKSVLFDPILGVYTFEGKRLFAETYTATVKLPDGFIIPDAEIIILREDFRQVGYDFIGTKIRGLREKFHGVMVDVDLKHLLVVDGTFAESK